MNNQPAPFSAMMRAARRRRLWETGATTEPRDDGREAIARWIPHRGDQLLLDQIVAFDPELRSLAVRRTVATDDPVFAGHFPGEPVYPASLQLEAVGQACLLLLAMLAGQPVSERGAPRLRTVHHASLLREVHPGAELEILARLISDHDLTALLAGQILVAGDIVAAAELEFVFK